jgi:hypothetical protein
VESVADGFPGLFAASTLRNPIDVDLVQMRQKPEESLGSSIIEPRSHDLPEAI